MSRQKGFLMEDRALAFFQKQGLKLLHRNFYCKMGEIDLIMEDQDTLVFIEVRYRSSHAFGGAVASVHYSKQQKLLKTAQYFLLRYPHYHTVPCRFDLAAFSRDNSEPEWIRNAF